MRDLDLILDSTLSMEKQVNSLCKSSYCRIRNMGLVYEYHNAETSKILAQALVIS